MPELPEVETNLRNLATWAQGRRLVEVTPPPGSRETGGLPAARFVSRLQGRTVQGLARKGKWILVALSEEAGLGIHLGMTGKLVRANEGEPVPRFSRATFLLDDHTRVHFVDPRRFGKLLAAQRYGDLLALPEIVAIGPDALGELTREALRTALSATRRTVKETIMDQRVVAGVGNLYATEALWHAKIHPATPAAAVAADPAALRRLFAGMRKALQHGLEFYRSAGIPQYVEEGGPNPFRAYDRTGAPCPRCRTRLVAITLGGRTTVFCPHCQPPPRKQ